MAALGKKVSTGGRKTGSGLKGKTIKHNLFGVGTITNYDGTNITAKFGSETKTLIYQICIDKGLIHIL